MKQSLYVLLTATTLACAVAGCSHLGGSPAAEPPPAAAAQRALQAVKAKYVPDSHLDIWTLGLRQSGRQLVLTGDVKRAEAKAEALSALRGAGFKVTDRATVVPTAELGDKLWGISCLSVASGRELPEHKAEMGTQILMGHVVQVWKRATNFWLEWFLAQSADGYPAWLEGGTFVRCTRAEAEAWQASPLLMVTAFEDRILEQPQADAEPVSDVVLADLVKKTSEQGDWFRVELPDGRAGFLPKASAEDYRAWQAKRQPTAENIERTARQFLGRPYLWGANSPKGMDCSGFTKTVFFLNGVDLLRNASHQARQGAPVPLDADLSQLRKGDLLFFGTRARGERPERIRHVGIYLGDKLFIHSSERVRISSLDPASPIRDENRIRTLLYARRVLKP